MTCTHSCRVCSSSRAILSSAISAWRLSRFGSCLEVTALPSTTTLGTGGRTGGGVFGWSGFAGDGKRFSVPCNDLVALHDTVQSTEVLWLYKPSLKAIVAINYYSKLIFLHFFFNLLKQWCNIQLCGMVRRCHHPALGCQCYCWLQNKNGRQTWG